MYPEDVSTLYHHSGHKILLICLLFIHPTYMIHVSCNDACSDHSALSETECNQTSMLLISEILLMFT